MNLSQILLNKASKNELAHFYIIESSAPEEEAKKILIDFTHQLIKDYYQKVESHKQSMIRLMDHPDVFVLGNSVPDDEKNEKFFKVEEAETLNRFFEFKPVQGLRKFAVVTEAHRINTIVANKWLKLFEEPQGNSTIFLLNPRRTQLLPTIHSRAIHLRLPSPSKPHDGLVWNQFISDVKKLSLSEFLEKFSKGETPIHYWINELIRWESEQNDNASPKQEFNKWLKSFNEMEVFNQLTATKWTVFYQYLKQQVLPRFK